MFSICFLPGEVGEYQVPYQNCVPNDPSIEDMKKVVVTQGIRPDIDERWKKSEVCNPPRGGCGNIRQGDVAILGLGAVAGGRWTRVIYWLCFYVFCCIGMKPERVRLNLHWAIGGRVYFTGYLTSA